MKYSQHQLNEIILRDWAVRVLDAHAKATACEWHMVLDAEMCRVRNHHPEPKHRVDLSYGSPGCGADTARLAAAEAVWPELPESVREDIGERPE